MGLTGSSGALNVYKAYAKKTGIVSHKLTEPEGIASVQFEIATGHAVNEDCHNTQTLPANSYGLVVSKTCLKENQKSWFDKWFGD